MKEIIQLLKEAETEAQINEIVDAYGLIILLDNYLSNCLRDARVRVNKKHQEEIVWETYQLN
jgi:nicotinate-nucleotide pyrophosphorylase